MQIFLKCLSNLNIYYAQLKHCTSESSSIISNATYIRNKAVFQPPFIIEQDENTRALKGHEVQERLEESIYAKGSDNVVVLTLSNKQANRWNNGIRKSIHFREETLEINESLLVIRNNSWIEPTSPLMRPMEKIYMSKGSLERRKCMVFSSRF